MFYPQHGKVNGQKKVFLKCVWRDVVNVGKSSFINAMLNHNGLAKVSGTPGKTRTLNFF